MYLARTAWCLPLSLLLVQSVPACDEAPREDAIVSLCAPPSSEEEPRAAEVTISTGTPLRIAVDQRARINHPGEVIRGKIVETVYAFDQVVIPAGSVATGHVKSIALVRWS